jgi:hypothetical protein
LIFLSGLIKPENTESIRGCTVKVTTLICCIAMIASFPSSQVYAEGVIRLPQTGQTATVRPGDDGNVRAGTASPTPRFTVSGDCVTDNLTGLMWAKDANLAGTVTWDKAIDYANTLTLCGHSDWRLPNINELESLISIGEADEATRLNGQGFTNVQPYWYWSSTAYAYYPGDVWVVSMRADYVYAGSKLYQYHAWPVRAGQEGGVARPWKTGQKEHFRKGDDGDLERGVAWPTPRFIASDDCVTDNLTGLMWAKNANAGGSVTWNEAIDYAKNVTLCGHSDWRLPNRKELRSLIDFGKWGPALPQGHPFTNVPSDDWCWSSSSDTVVPERAWVGKMWHGLAGAHSKNLPRCAWPVRGK